MKISVFGGDSQIVSNVIKKFENGLKTEAVHPKLTVMKHAIVDVASETYGHNKRKNVVFDMCVLQFITPELQESDENLFDTYEQIVLTSLVNIDKVVIVAVGMSDELIDFYNDYREMMPDKIFFVTSEDDIVF